eukprot:1157516-Pelagomonas_calceolata.AAC.2
MQACEQGLHITWRHAGKMSYWVGASAGVKRGRARGRSHLLGCQGCVAQHRANDAGRLLQCSNKAVDVVLPRLCGTAQGH